MAVTPELLIRARKGRRDAVVMLLSEHYPTVYRVAHALAGRDDVARGIVRHVMPRSLPALLRWDNPADPQRWFMHYTLLTARRSAHHEPTLAGDPLIREAATSSAYYPAFVRALRALPMQQREAYLLHHGERLDQRALAVAMDCSVEAAMNHLREANAALMAYSGDYFAAFTAHLSQTYAGLTPSEEVTLPAVRSSVRRYMWPRRLMRLTSVTVKLAILAVFLFLGWKLLPLLPWKIPGSWAGAGH